MVIYYAYIILINLPLEPFYLLKKPHQHPLHSFKDLSFLEIYWTKELTLFYTMYKCIISFRY
uniref:SFRICE_011603 n=1 Tax=Spodoptera frugiperda TaxID=7108 RepID=A0A2H1WGM9_SPOFR